MRTRRGHQPESYAQQPKSQSHKAVPQGYEPARLRQLRPQGSVPDGATASQTVTRILIRHNVLLCRQRLESLPL